MRTAAVPGTSFEVWPHPYQVDHGVFRSLRFADQRSTPAAEVRRNPAASAAVGVSRWSQTSVAHLTVALAGE